MQFNSNALVTTISKECHLMITKPQSNGISSSEKFILFSLS